MLCQVLYPGLSGGLFFQVVVMVFLVFSNFNMTSQTIKIYILTLISITSNCIDVELMATKWGCNFRLLCLQFRVARIESMLNETFAKCCAKWCFSWIIRCPLSSCSLSSFSNFLELEYHIANIQIHISTLKSYIDTNFTSI